MDMRWSSMLYDSEFFLLLPDLKAVLRSFSAESGESVHIPAVIMWYPAGDSMDLFHAPMRLPYPNLDLSTEVPKLFMHVPCLSILLWQGQICKVTVWYHHIIWSWTPARCCRSLYVLCILSNMSYSVFYCQATLGEVL